MTRRIVAYVAVIVGALTAMFLALPWPPGWPHFGVAAAFLIPGRIQGILWRSFFRGRHALSRKDFQAAETHFQLFLDKLRQSPKLQLAAYLSWNFYTWNAESMTRSNLGVCHLLQHRLEPAEAELKRAIDLDPECPVPYFNLAILAHARGAEEEAERLLTMSARLGYRAATRERLISAAGRMLAAVEGRY